MADRFSAICAGLALLNVACFRQVPTSIETVAVGTEVSCSISADAQLAVKDQLGVSLRTLDGKVLAKPDGRLVLLVGLTDPLEARPTSVLYQQVQIANHDVVRLALRQVRPARTAGLVAVLVGAAVYVSIRMMKGGEPGQTVPPRETGGERVQGVLPVMLNPRR